MAVAVMAVAAILYAQDGIWPVVPQLAERPSDFENYYLAARNLAAGESPFAVARYDYPPIIAFVLWPLAQLSYEAARWVWFLVSHGCILGAAVLSWKALGRDRLAAGVVALVWSCGGTLQENLALGQVNPVLLLLIAYALFGGVGGWPRGASWALGAAIAAKLWPAALLPALGLAAGPRGDFCAGGLASGSSGRAGLQGRAPDGSSAGGPDGAAREGRSGSGALPGGASAGGALPGGLLGSRLSLPGFYRIRPMIAALAVAFLLIAAPLATLAAFYPPPHAPTHSGAWMGTPALLNFSLAAAVLRLLDFPVSSALPHNWQFGNDMLELRLDANDALISVGLSAAVALVGFLVLALRVWRMTGLADCPTPRFSQDRAIASAGNPLLSREFALALLLPLALATLPLSWSHYQLLQLPGAALFLVLALRNRNFWQAGAVGLLFLMTYQAPVALLRMYLEWYGWTAASAWSLWLVTVLSPVASVALFVLYLRILNCGGDIAGDGGSLSFPGISG
jgi:hypothetical protein